MGCLGAAGGVAQQGKVSGRSLGKEGSPPAGLQSRPTTKSAKRLSQGWGSFLYPLRWLGGPFTLSWSPGAPQQRGVSRERVLALQAVHRLSRGLVLTAALVPAALQGPQGLQGRRGLPGPRGAQVSGCCPGSEPTTSLGCGPPHHALAE